MINAMVNLIRVSHGVSPFHTGLCLDSTSINTGINTGSIRAAQNAFNKRPPFFFKLVDIIP